jgi:hypothetical protein
MRSPALQIAGPVLLFTVCHANGRRCHANGRRCHDERGTAACTVFLSDHWRTKEQLMLVKERLRFRKDQVQRNGSKMPGLFSGKLLLWIGINLPCLGVIYWHVISAGIRVQMPVFGLPLRKLPLPGFSYLGRYEGLYKLDLANIFSVCLLFAVWHLWIVMLRIHLLGDDTRSRPQRIDRDKYRRMVLRLGIPIVLGDTLIFYCGVSDKVDALWGASSIFVPIVASAIYMSLLAFIAFIHVLLETESQPTGEAQ